MFVDLTRGSAALVKGPHYLLANLPLDQAGMSSRIAWTLAGACAALLLVLAMTGFLVGGGARHFFPTAAHMSPAVRPQPIVVQSPTRAGPITTSPSSGSPITTPSSSGGIFINPSPIVIAPPSPTPYDARFQEFPIPEPGGRPYAVIVGPDGAVWFTEQECASGIGLLSKSGQWQHYPITGNCESQPLAITRGPDGNFWFADVWSGYGSITPEGVITNFKTSSASYPVGITTGPDGNLWLAASTAQSTAFVAKIAPDGNEITEFPLPHGQTPRGIVAGPDGAMWFTESLGIGRMTTAGELTEFPLPNDNGSGMPYQIAVGPDRNLWFVEETSGDGRIGRLTPAGQLTEFATPGMVGLQWITAGRDNAMWFTAWQSRSIGRISLDGAVWSYPVPGSGSNPIGITVGPDGKIWFSEVDAKNGKLGVFTPGAA
jgi:virginiamycin B lyase